MIGANFVNNEHNKYHENHAKTKCNDNGKYYNYDRKISSSILK